MTDVLKTEKICSMLYVLFDELFEVATIEKGFDAHFELSGLLIPFNRAVPMIQREQLFKTASPLMRMRLYLSFYDFFYDFVSRPSFTDFFSEIRYEEFTGTMLLAVRSSFLINCAVFCSG